MVNFNFKGLMAPTLTPFNKDLTLNLDVIPKYAKFLSEQGIRGILVNGTSGEGMSLTVAERKLVTEVWLKAGNENNQHVMVQVGGAPLPDVLELAKHAEQIGVHSLLCLPELYFKPKTLADLIHYLSVVGAAAPKTSLLYYHIPSNTAVNIHMGEFLNEAAGKIPTFAGIKFTSTNLHEGMSAVKANNGKFAVLLGCDQLLAGAFTMGFNSSIGTTFNMFPQYGIKILESIKQAKLEEARKTQDSLTTICDTLEKYGSWVPIMKTAMNLYTPINVGLAREPLKNLTEEEVNKIKGELKAFKLELN